MSAAFPITKRCAARQDHSVDAWLAQLDKIAGWEWGEWRQLNKGLVYHEGFNTRFYGVPLHDPDGRAEFQSQATFSMGQNASPRARNVLKTLG